MGEEAIPDAKSMDGPVVKYTVADLFQSSPRLFMTYHVMGTPFNIFNTAGVLLGGVLALTPLRKRFPSALALMGTSGMIAGCGGMALGLAKMNMIAGKGDANEPIPWNDEGIQQRVDGISHNFKVRVLDISVWTGIGLATGALFFAGGPAKLGLSGKTLGVLQAMSVGSAIGGLSAFGCIFSTLPKKDDDDNED